MDHLGRQKTKQIRFPRELQQLRRRRLRDAGCTSPQTICEREIFGYGSMLFTENASEVWCNLIALGELLRSPRYVPRKMSVRKRPKMEWVR